jgi:hypothetical protein
MSVVTDKAMLASLKISRWSASKHDKNITEEVAKKHGADPTMGRYSKRLIAKERLEEIAQIATRARHHHYENTLPWLDDGARILPAANYFDYMQQQNDLKALFEQAVAGFAREYPAYVDEAKRSLNGLFRPEDYPAASDIAGMFAMTVEIAPMPEAEDFRVSLSDAENARIREQIQGRLDEAVEGAMQHVWERMFEAVERMVERLKNYSVDSNGKVKNAFRDSLVTNIRELVELLPKLNITGNNMLEDMRHRLNDELCQIDATVLRENATVRKEVAQNAEAILAEIKNAMA